VLPGHPGDAAYPSRLVTVLADRHLPIAGLGDQATADVELVCKRFTNKKNKKISLDQQNTAYTICEILMPVEINPGELLPLITVNCGGIWLHELIAYPFFKRPVLVDEGVFQQNTMFDKPLLSILSSHVFGYVAFILLYRY
jgi:hypothetical protein